MLATKEQLEALGRRLLNEAARGMDWWESGTRRGQRPRMNYDDCRDILGEAKSVGIDVGSRGEGVPALPRRGDEDKREATDAPAFLVQLRRFQPTELSSLDWCADRESLIYDDEEITDEEAVEQDLGVWIWYTQSVWFTREEAQAWADAKSYRGPWRVYSVPTKGALRLLLRAQTDYEADAR